MIVCKFHCQSVKVNVDQAGAHSSEEIEMHAVYGDANKPWSKFTPSGSFRVQITNPDAMGKFRPGKQYLLHVEEAPVEA